MYEHPAWKIENLPTTISPSPVIVNDISKLDVHIQNIGAIWVENVNGDW